MFETPPDDSSAGSLKSSKWKNVKHLQKAHCYWIVVRNSKRCEVKKEEEKMVSFTAYESVVVGRGPVGLEPMFRAVEGFEHLHPGHDLSILGVMYKDFTKKPARD